VPDDVTPVVVDARGKRCPLPVILLARAARGAGAGARIDVLTTDPAAGPDIAAWCRMRGHDLLEQHPLPGPGELSSAVRLSAGSDGPPTTPPAAASEGAR
jgi:TusA-related sulfurtransferase